MKTKLTLEELIRWLDHVAERRAEEAQEPVRMLVTMDVEGNRMAEPLTHDRSLTFLRRAYEWTVVPGPDEVQ